MERLASLLIERGQCDPRTLERGRRVAEESGQRLDTVLIQLGMITERVLAEAFSENARPASWRIRNATRPRRCSPTG